MATQLTLLDPPPPPLVGTPVTLANVGWEVEAVSGTSITLVHLQHAIWLDRYPRVAITLPLPDVEAFASRSLADGQVRSDCPRCGLRHFWQVVRYCGACRFDPVGEGLWSKATATGPIEHVVGPNWLRMLPHRGQPD